jgi:hypothetical protein
MILKHQLQVSHSQNFFKQKVNHHSKALLKNDANIFEKPLQSAKKQFTNIEIKRIKIRNESSQSQ